jgi:hypothetical protein
VPYVLNHFSGIHIIMWTLAKEQQYLTYSLCLWVKDNVHSGFKHLIANLAMIGRVFYMEIPGSLGSIQLPIQLSKIALFLYEYYSESYSSMLLPPLAGDRSRMDVHGVLKPHEVHIYISCIALTVRILLTVQGSLQHFASTKGVSCHMTYPPLLFSCNWSHGASLGLWLGAGISISQ